MTFAGVGLILSLIHAFLALLVILSIGEARKRGSATAGSIYLIVAVATIAWIWKAAEWLR